jgi:hypothetical protein
MYGTRRGAFVVHRWRSPVDLGWGLGTQCVHSMCDSVHSMFFGRPSKSVSLAAATCATAVLAQDVGTTQGVSESSLPVESRAPLIAAAVAVHATIALGCCLFLCTWGHRKSFTTVIALLLAIWATAFAWLRPLLSPSLPWLYVSPTASMGPPDCDYIEQCNDFDAVAAAGAGVLLCAAEVCMPPAVYSSGLQLCRLPYGVVPTEQEKAATVYVRLEAEGAALKTTGVKSDTRRYDWDQGVGLDEKLSRRRQVRRELEQGMALVSTGLSTAGVPSRATLLQEESALSNSISFIRAQRRAELRNRCLVLSHRPSSARVAAATVERWKEQDTLIGTLQLPRIQDWDEPLGCSNFGETGTMLLGAVSPGR